MTATTVPDLRPFLKGYTDRCRVYRFPNGHTATVHIAGSTNNIVWDVWCEALPGEYAYGLTSMQVQETLTRIYRMPGN